MDFRKHIETKQLLPKDVLQDVINNSLANRYTVFEELWKNGAKYNVAEDVVLNAAVEAGEGAIHIVKSTRGISPYLQGFRALGGVDMAIQMKAFPIIEQDKTITFVVARPDDPAVLHKIEKAADGKIYGVAVVSKFIYDAIYSTYVEPLFIEVSAARVASEEVSKRGADSERHDSEARKVYRRILDLGIDRGASDIHIMPLRDTCHIIYRIDGINYRLMEVPKAISERVSNILCTDAGVQRKGDLTAADGKLEYTPSPGHGGGVKRDLRFSMLPSTKGIDINIRYLNDKMYTFEDLGMTESNVKTYKSLLQRPQGLIMQVGPTGSGKSTTLYAGLQYINQTSLRNIITVEDPVEITMDGITQVTTNDATGLTFANVVRQFLRHDVDVGIVGEIRDEETALEAVRAATTGHLIISSLHTNDSIGVFERLNRLGVDPYTLGEVLVAVMSQRLVRRLCPHCKEAYNLDLSSNKAKHYRLPTAEGTATFYKAVGCEHCHNIGYVGRVAVNEILQIDGRLRHLIQMHAPRVEFEKYLYEKHFMTMYEDALNKARAGITSLEELEPMCSDTLAFKVIQKSNNWR